MNGEQVTLVSEFGKESVDAAGLAMIDPSKINYGFDDDGDFILVIPKDAQPSRLQLAGTAFAGEDLPQELIPELTIAEGDNGNKYIAGWRVPIATVGNLSSGRNGRRPAMFPIGLKRAVKEDVELQLLFQLQTAVPWTRRQKFEKEHGAELGEVAEEVVVEAEDVGSSPPTATEPATELETV
jgi:hypothetical protein